MMNLRTNSLLMLDELHRLGFEQLRFTSMGGHRVDIYAARDEARPGATDQRLIPAVRRFTTPMFGHEPHGTEHLASKWDTLLRGGLKPNHLAGMFVLDFPDIARHGFGPDLTYREWFGGLRERLKQGAVPITHPHNSFNTPFAQVEWLYGTPERRDEHYRGPPANEFLHHTPGELEDLRDPAQPYERTRRSLLMLNELHRFGFEQLRFSSFGGHGYAHIYAARDEAHTNEYDERFVPALRRFNTLISIDGAPARDRYLAQKWDALLGGSMKPNHLAGLFVLDFPEISRGGFGPDERYREWFRELHTLLRNNPSDIPITHNHVHAQPLRFLKWSSQSQRAYPAPPANSYLIDPA